jgi:hypothetical protein
MTAGTTATTGTSRHHAVAFFAVAFFAGRRQTVALRSPTDARATPTVDGRIRAP